MVLDACGLSFRIWGDSHREDKKQGRSHSFHFLTVGNEHILAEWKTKGHYGGGGMNAVCTESWDRAGTCKHLWRGQSLVLKVLKFIFAFLSPLTPPSNTWSALWSLVKETWMPAIYVTYGRFGVIICIGKLFGFMNNQFSWANRCTKEPAGSGSITVAVTGNSENSNKLTLHQSKWILKVAAWK